MDPKSFRTLEFDKVRAILTEYTSFSAGEELARKLTPTDDRREAEQWQAETAEAIELLETRSNVTIGGARDVRGAANNAQRGFTLPAEDLLDVRNTIIAARNLRRRLLKAADDFPRLADIADLIEECHGLVSAISSTLDDRGEVLDSASTRLAKIRQQQRTVHGRIQEKLQSILHGSLGQYLQEPIITTRSGRYVLPVKAEAKGRVKGIVHDQSGSGATLWMEPMGTVELNNEYRELQLQEEEEVQRILADLSAQVGEQGDAVKRVVDRMAELDLIFARARYAMVVDGIRPEFVDWREFEEPQPPKHANERAKWTPPPPNLHPGSTVWVKGARHPLLDPNLVVPTDLTVDEDTFTVLITGPNTGGKTVSLKTLGLMVIMAQSGLHLPATEAKLTVFDHVFADIGDEQSIEQSLSTFSAHMNNIIRILEQVDDRSLVLLDELGSGTDPTEGAALAQSIVSYLRDKGATTFVATHYPELKVYASQTPGAVNASLLFDVDTLSPTYEMSIGIPGRSNAFAIARRLGLDETILDDAMKLVGAGSHEAEDLLESIYELREKILSEEAATRLAQRQAEEDRDALARRLELIEEEREQLLEEAREQAEAEIEALRDEIRAMRRTIRSADSRTKLKKLNKQIEQIGEDALSEIAPVTEKPEEPALKPGDLEEGDKVQIKTLNTEGEVVSVSKKEAVVAVGRMQMRAKLSDLAFKERPQPEEEVESSYVTAGSSPGMELDLRGQRVEEGLTTLTGYIDSAFLAQLPWVRIIHGKGTGRLRSAVRKALKQNRHVASWEEGKTGEGGAGVTVAKLVGHND